MILFPPKTANLADRESPFGIVRGKRAEPDSKTILFQRRSKPLEENSGSGYGKIWILEQTQMGLLGKRQLGRKFKIWVMEHGEFEAYQLNLTTEGELEIGFQYEREPLKVE